MISKLDIKVWNTELSLTDKNIRSVHNSHAQELILKIIGQCDVKHIIGQCDVKHIIGQCDVKHIIGQCDVKHIIGQCDVKHIMAV